MSGVSLTIEADMRDVLTALDRTQRTVLPQATAAAINKTMTTVKTDTARGIAKNKRLKVGSMKKRMRIKKANWRRMVGVINAIFTPANIAAAGKARQVRAGVKANKHLFPDAFIATMPKGGDGAYRRKGAKRFPVEAVTIPLMPEARRILYKVAKRRMGKRFRVVLYQELRFRLGRRGLL